ncbi:condensation domain-containing protein, partial [Flavivirga jejuensis]|uniref:condensation domain-containing protein n=1 Tax=Flavivirga jejuensis TaxID=870487 RepID=UPI0031EC5AAA
RYSGQGDICVGSSIANRTQSDLEGMIGFFVNTLALRSDLSGNPSFREVLGRVKETTLSAYDHQLVPFEKVVDRVVETRDMSMSPLFQVMFDLQNTPEEKDVALSNLVVSSYEYTAGTSQFDLTLNAEQRDAVISLDMEYCSALFDKATVVRMLAHYQELLIGIVSNINQKIGSLSMLPATEEHQLLRGFNDTSVSYPLEKTVVDLFEEQVLKSPESIALLFEGEELSYKELDDRSNQLAHYLVSEGVNVDDLVGICLDRSIAMVVGILGILKSGGAYVPMKPDYPASRISHIISDGDIRLVVTDEL